VHQFLLDRHPRRPPPVAGETVLLSAAESHHLTQVLRANQGQALRLTDGRGRLYAGDYAGKEGSRARVLLRAAWDDPEEQIGPRLGLACSVVKGRRFEWVLEKAVELGVHRIWPLRTRRGVVEPGPGRQERWLGLLQAALKQSGRSWLPQLEPTVSVADLLPQLQGMSLLYGDCDPVSATGEDAGAGLASGTVPSGQPALAWLLSAGAGVASAGGEAPAWLVWAVGPEGGWDEPERQQLAAAGRALSLGPHRLRTETAAVAGLALLQLLRSG
jgi:16S rRNA (uracil1498-N3)-methyltransferase